MMFSDYYPVAKKHNVNTPEFYADLAAAFINDKDASKDKVEKYYECVVEWVNFWKLWKVQIPAMLGAC